MAVRRRDLAFFDEEQLFGIGPLPLDINNAIAQAKQHEAAFGKPVRAEIGDIPTQLMGAQIG